MNAGQSSAQDDALPAGRVSQKKYAALLVSLTILGSLAAIALIQPRVGPWLEVRSAYRNLSSADYDERNDAIRRLRRLGKETESELIGLLHHADEGVRRFAAGKLAHRTPVSDDVIEAFLNALEGNHDVAEIGHAAPKLFVRHADSSTGPITKTDRRMLTWLRAELECTDPERSGTAAWALTAFLKRDPSLREQLDAFLKNAGFFHKYLVLREMVDSNPSLRDQYVDVLFSGLASSVHSDRSNALYGLANLKNKPADLGLRLEVLRDRATDSEEISRINQVLKAIGKDTAEQP